MTILYWRNKTCLCCPLIYNKKKNIKKSNLAFLALAGLLSLCYESVFILLSSLNIPTLKYRSVLSDPFISAGGSWTLRKFSSLFLSGVGSVEESESLLLMPPGSHSLLSQRHTGQNNSQWKIKFVLVEDAYLQSQHIVKISRDSDKKKRGCYRVKLSLQWVSVRNEGRELNKESRWSDWPSFHKLHQRAQVNNNLSSAKQLMLDFSRPILMISD